MISHNAHSRTLDRHPGALAQAGDLAMLKDLSIVILSLQLTIIVGLVLIINAALIT